MVINVNSIRLGNFNTLRERGKKKKPMAKHFKSSIIFSGHTEFFLSTKRVKAIKIIDNV
jgi:hypothetical protein